MSRETSVGDPYDNCVVLHPDGTPMFYCDRKKIRWYLKRNLATTVNDTTVQLIFVPKGMGDMYANKVYKNKKNNNCVVCNTTEKLTRHHVVPVQYRRYFPLEYKSHNHFDIVPLCGFHHDEYERKAAHLNNLLRSECNIPSNTNYSSVNNHKAEKVLGIIATLIRDWDMVPIERRDMLVQKIKDFTGIDEVTKESIHHILIKVEDKVPLVPYASLVVEKNKDNINGFIVRWRKHFLDTMKPQYMPESWIEEHEEFFHEK